MFKPQQGSRRKLASESDRRGRKSYDFATAVKQLSNHHCGGGAYGATGATGAPYVTGAVAQGLHVGGQTGGGAGVGQQTAAGRRSQLQQQQPVLPRQRVRIATMSDVLFMIVSPYVRGTSVDSITASARGQFAAASAG